MEKKEEHYRSLSPHGRMSLPSSRNVIKLSIRALILEGFEKGFSP